MKEYGLGKYITGRDVKELRTKIGMSRKDFASLAGVSLKTVEYWESGDKEITGPIVFMHHMLTENLFLEKKLEVPEPIYPLRLMYMYKNFPCTLIDVDEVRQLVQIKNFTDLLMYRAFGPVETPDYMQFTEFLESRCFPRTRDKLKLELERLEIPFYDPLLIIEKTEGRMAEDLFSLKILRNGEWL